ncbi:hypothetical protein BK718_16960 [Bacillus thuringiensis serovar andalousiensis]|uniref:DUF8088 domain-containing protein n=1 Tax=Bacillus thuringiensis TaxID=1428 RepID=A0A9X6Q3Y4_BACTU|nr:MULTISPECIES: hypothetical protein [Bacillus cereus group]MDA2612039.1 hypothetical protein [Bacillus cereus]MEB8727265.1 hypothetical protein [Bacillus cereus]MEB8822075.1 hypothetical protein [Bacillus cereus]MEB8974633.1 hypothetical protein [Bacillus cereus]MEB9132178.1 hypothetical protein [Bacillus cereus]
MNKVTINFGPGTAAWKDMQEVAKVLQEKGYSVEPKEDIGIVKLTKDISDEPVIRKIGDLKVGDQVMYQDEVETIHSISRDTYGEYDVQIGCYHEKFCQTSEFEVIE